MQTVNLVAVVSLAFVAPLIVAAVNTAAQGPEAVEAALGLDRQTRRLIQQGLESEGFDPGPPDGLFGPRTRAAIRTWQAARELADTGYVDGPQAEALRAAGSPPAAGGGDTEAGVPGASVLAVSDRKASEAEPVSASGTVETSMSAVVPPPAVQAAPMINPGADAPAARAARNSQLPPVILIDRHLVRVDRLLAADDHQEASEVLNEIVALQREHDLTLPAEFHFAHAQVAFAAGLAEAAVTAANKYLAAAGRDGQFYRDALKLLDAAEVAIVNADLPPQPGDVFRDCDVCPEMVVMPGGRLALGRYEVTVAEYRAFVSATGKSPDDCWQDPGHPQTLRHPVTCLDWHDVQAYLSWLSHTAQAPYRLPTEREWERAAVGSTRGCARPRVDSDDRTCPVGSYGANLWGLSDMVGNVSEVTATCYHDDFCSHHVARGGSWLVITAPIDGNDDQWGYHYPAATDREQMGLAARWSTAGFRVARRVDVVDMLDAAEQAVRRAEAERGRLATLRRENDELARRQVELAAVPLPRDPLRSGGLAPAMVTVAAGSFQYRTSQHWRWGSRPHLEWVTFDRPFAIGKYEVTRGDFELFVSRARYRTDARRDPEYGCEGHQTRARQRNSGLRWNRPGFDQTTRHPVTCVSVHDAVAYANWLSQQTGHRYRLPGAADWQYVDRAGSRDAMLYVSRDDLQPPELCRYAHVGGYGGCLGDDRDDASTAEVGRLLPNAIGIHDMAGNVSEILLACFHPSSSNNLGYLSPHGLPENPRNCEHVDTRGSSWSSSFGYILDVNPSYERAGDGVRYHRNSNSHTGFRLVRELLE